MRLRAQTSGSGTADEPNKSWTATTDREDNNLRPTRIVESHSQSENGSIDQQSLQVRGFGGDFEPYQEIQKDTQKVDEFAEAQRVLNGPAGNPECVWLGRRVVSLLWRDDLDTAFRHLDLYDRFGCPSGHIQATFRCLVLHANTIDPKAADSLNGRVHACWINPSLPPAPTPAAAVPSPTTTR